jgi:RNA polymerase sigma-70 factor (ECF subfamily)
MNAMNSTLPIPENAPAASKALARELLVMLGERREEFLAFVKRRVRSGADAEDLLQQGLLRAAEKLDSLRATDRLEAWFFRVLRNTIADHHAAWAMRESKLELLAREASEAPPEEAAVCACSLGMLDDIRPEYAAILKRIDIEGESMAEAATNLGLTVNNTKVRLHRARKALREALLSHCGASSARACQDCCCDET